MTRLWTIGYERLLPEALVAELRAAGVRRVLDVRYRPQSRRPGMSMTRLGALLGEHGIAYEARRGLGTPPDLRFLYRAGRIAEASAGFRRHLDAHGRRGARRAGRRAAGRAAYGAAVPGGGSRPLPPARGGRGARPPAR